MSAKRGGTPARTGQYGQEHRHVGEWPDEGNQGFELALVAAVAAALVTIRVYTAAERGGQREAWHGRRQENPGFYRPLGSLNGAIEHVLASPNTSTRRSPTRTSLQLASG